MHLKISLSADIYNYTLFGDATDPLTGVPIVRI